jgi:hypothetical protein
MLRAVCLASLGAALCFGDSVTFSAIPNANLASLKPSETSGWGYSIDNKTSFYVLPLGLADSGVLFGSLSDIFDYPVVSPGQFAFQTYSYNAPGGWGNSLGLFEYAMPDTVPIGLDQSGFFTFTYQLYDGNPDLDYSARAVGSAIAQTVSFDVIAGDGSETVIATPEPASLWLLLGVTGVLVGSLKGRHRRVS